MSFRQLIIRHIFWRGLYFLSVFGVNVLLSREFRADGSGWIYYVVNNLSFLLLLVSLCLEAGTAYYVSDGEMPAASAAGFCLIWSLVGAGLGAAFIGWMIPAAPRAFGSRLELNLACIIYVFGVLLSTYFAALFFARKHFVTPNAILLGVNLVLIAWLALERNSPMLRAHIVLFYFSFFLLQGIILLSVFLLQAGSVKFPSTSLIGKLFRYSLLALVGNAIFFLVCRVDYWFVRGFCSLSDLGNYIQASKLAQAFLLVPSITASTLFPLVAGGQREEVNQGLQVLTRGMLGLIGLFLILLGLAGWWAFPAIFGKTFSEMPLLFILFIPGILALTAHYPLTAYYSGKKRLEVNIRGSLLGLGVIVTGDWFGIPRFGVWAAPVVSSLGYAF